jgi:hypothetical protein
MKMTLSTSQAADMLYADRENAGWSWAGARALVEHLEQLEEDTGEEIEFDAIAIRCDYDEYENAVYAASQYPYEADEELDSTDAEEAALDWLRDQTDVITFDGGVIIRAF